MAPSGTGKTVLLRTLCAAQPEARYRLHEVRVTSLSCRDMCREIAVAVSLEPVGTDPTLMRRLQQHFRTQSQDVGMLLRRFGPRQQAGTPPAGCPP